MWYIPRSLSQVRETIYTSTESTLIETILYLYRGDR